MNPTPGDPQGRTQTVYVYKRPFLWTEGEGLDPEAVTALSGYIHQLSYKYRRQAMRMGHTREDIYQAGMVGALMAAKTYDPEQSAFITWAHWRILQHVGLLLGEGEVRVPKSTRDRIDASGMPRLISLATPLQSGDEFGSRIPSNDEPAFDLVANQEAVRLIAGALPRLRDRERNVILRRANGERLESIASSLGVSRQRAHQIEQAGLTALRALVKGGTR